MKELQIYLKKYTLFSENSKKMNFLYKIITWVKLTTESLFTVFFMRSILFPFT